MKKKILMVILAGVLVGSMESAMVYAGRMPELTKTESSNKSSVWEDYLKEHSERGVKEQFIKEHVGDLSDEQLDHMIGAYFGDDESLDNEDSCNDGYQDSDEFPVSLYSYIFQEEIGGNDYDFVQYTAVVNQGSGNVQVLLPKGCKFVTGYGKLTDGYRAYDSLDEAVQKGEDICLSEGLSENLPDSNVICWDAKGDGTYTFAVEKTGDAEDDAIWLVDGYGYTGSEDLTGKVTEPDEDLDSDMLVGGALSEESYHGTLDGDLFFLLRRK